MKLSKIVSRQIPEHIRENHPKFVKFIQYYYEFLETIFEKAGEVQGGYTVNESFDVSYLEKKKAGDYYLVTRSGYFNVGDFPTNPPFYAKEGEWIVFNSDKNVYVKTSSTLNALFEKDLSSNSQISIFIDALKNEMAYTLPKSKLEQLELLQNIKQLYLTKGSEESFKFLFRILFSKYDSNPYVSPLYPSTSRMSESYTTYPPYKSSAAEVDIAYPRDQVLRTSDGKWIQKQSLFVRKVFGDAFQTVQKTVDVFTKNEKRFSRVIDVVDRGDVYSIAQLDLRYVEELVRDVIELGYVPEDVDSIFTDMLNQNVYSNVYEFFVDRSYTKKEYAIDDIIISTENNKLFVGMVVGTTVKAEILDGGRGFRIGDVIDIPASKGAGSQLKVTKIGKNGTIAEVDFLRFGFGYLNPLILKCDRNTSVLVSESKDVNNPIPTEFQSNFDDKTYGFLETGIISAGSYGQNVNTIASYLLTKEGRGYNKPSVTFYPPETAKADPIVHEVTIENLDGRIFSSTESSIITGKNTKFLLQVSPNQLIKTRLGLLGKVKNIVSDTEVELYEKAKRKSIGLSAQTFEYVVVGIDIKDPGINVSSDTKIDVSDSYSYPRYPVYNRFWAADYSVEYVDSEIEISPVYGVDPYWSLDYSGDELTTFEDIKTLAKDVDNKATIRVMVGGLAKYPGYYEDNSGFTSSDIYLQDSKFYQNFSYVVKSELPMSVYESYVKINVHPLGMKMFGEYSIKSAVGFEIPDNVFDTKLIKRIKLELEDVSSMSDIPPSSVPGGGSGDEQDTSPILINPASDLKVEFNDLVTASDNGKCIYTYTFNGYTIPTYPYQSRMWDSYVYGDIETQDLTSPSFASPENYVGDLVPYTGRALENYTENDLFFNSASEKAYTSPVDQPESRMWDFYTADSDPNFKPPASESDFGCVNELIEKVPRYTDPGKPYDDRMWEMYTDGDMAQQIIKEYR